MGKRIEPGVVKKDKNGFSEYHKKTLNVSYCQNLQASGICAFFIVAYFVTTIVIPCYIAKSTPKSTFFDDYSTHSRQLTGFRAFLCVLVPIVQGIFVFWHLCDVLRRTTVTQVVDGVHLSAPLIAVLFAFIIPWLAALFFMYGFIHWQEIIFFNVFEAVNLLWFVASCRYSRTHCKCKTCKNIKDVKIWYSGECLERLESQVITSEILVRYFSIPLSKLEILAIQLENGNIIHKFESETPSVQLYEGNYKLVKVTTTSGVNIHYKGVTKIILESDKFDEHMLKEWFNIESTGSIGLQSDFTGQIMHPFHNQKRTIALRKGHYNIQVTMDSEQQAPFSKTVVCETLDGEDQVKSTAPFLNNID